MPDNPFAQAINAYLQRREINGGLERLWERPDRQRISALCWLVVGGRVLLLCREKEPFSGYWTAPGGKLNPGEDPSEAVKRELWEETGLTIADPRLRAVASELGGPDYDWLLFLFRASAYEGELRESTEGPLRWVPLAELDRTRMADVDRRLALHAFGEEPPEYVRVRYAPDHSITSWETEPLAAG